MISFVTFKWATPGYRSTFAASHVNTLRRMVERHYPKTHEFVCVTDDFAGLDPQIKQVRLWDTHADVLSPHSSRFPSCYRRLRLFAPEAAELIGERMVMLDLDAVIVGDIRPLIDRPEDFVAWSGTTRGGGYNCSLVLLRAGSRTRVWEEFNPTQSPRLAHSAGYVGSDQGWISYCLGKDAEQKFSKKDGVYSYRLDILPARGRLPDDARIVFWNGQEDPWSEESQKLAWVRHHYR